MWRRGEAVVRPKDVEEGRSNLPIVMMEQEIMEAINENAVVIVCGETGCGKTTQIPQFLYEAGFGSKHCRGREGMIAVTQPRRVAVLSTAKRVAYELNKKLGREVGFQVRHDRKVGEDSVIKFMTDGILLRELQADFLLRKYSVIVLDEAHERSLNTDILIGMLSRVVVLRQNMHVEQCKALQGELGKPSVTPLKLVIMSATLRVEDFVSNNVLFKVPPPVMHVPARQYPVTIHFSAKTDLKHYEDRAFRKVSAIHRKLPPGGILVFLTGHREVESLCSRLRKSFGRRRRRMVEMSAGQDGDAINQLPAVGSELDAAELEAISKAVDEVGDCHGGMDQVECSEEADNSSAAWESAEHGMPKDKEYSKLSDGKETEGDSPPDFSPGSEFIGGPSTPCEKNAARSDSEKQEIDVSVSSSKSKPEASKDLGALYVLPLYAMLPAVAQLRVFAAVPKGMRLVVVATNVAETSITIPGIRYVVDSGRAKARNFDRASGISRFDVEWISKASADQRAGRAGRTGPGHCYRLYSSAHFNDTFPEFSAPEIMKSPIEGVVLLMKHMGIDKVMNFPFPTPPERISLVEADRCLKALSALDPCTGSLTPVGRAMAVYPVSPRHSRMLLAALESAHTLLLTGQKSSGSLFLALAIAVVAALSLENPLLKNANLPFGSVNGNVDGDLLASKTEACAKEKGSVAGAQGAEGEIRSNGAEKAERKFWRSAINAAHAKFWNESSDALCIVKALHGYEQCEEAEDFCRVNFLHERTMNEISKLRKQLSRLVVHFSREAGTGKEVLECLAESETYWRQPILKLEPRHEGLLQKAICAGWADKLARKLSSQDRAKVEDEKHRKGAMYQACSVDELVYIHPCSPVYKQAPEYVAYCEIVYTSRPYMCGVTAIHSDWLVSQAGALCTFSKPVADPPPWYDSGSDEIMCWVSPSFGPHLWQLPLHAFPMKSGKLRTLVFAGALLQGKVVPCVRRLHTYLSADPSIIFKPESMAHKRVGELIHRLGSASHVVCSRKLLNMAWEADASFLYLELKSWVQKGHQDKLDKLWGDMLKEAKLDGSSLFGSKRKRA